MLSDCEVQSTVKLCFHVVQLALGMSCDCSVESHSTDVILKVPGGLTSVPLKDDYVTVI